MHPQRRLFPSRGRSSETAQALVTSHQLQRPARPVGERCVSLPTSLYSYLGCSGILSLWTVALGFSARCL